MIDIEKANVTELKKYVKDNSLGGSFKKQMGSYVSKSSKADIKSFLSTFNNKPLISKVSKLSDPDPEKLQKIRDKIPKVVDTPVEIITKKEIVVENVHDLDDEDLELLNEIVTGDEPTPEGSGPATTTTTTETTVHEYIYDETNEVKCDKLSQLYPQLKEINKSDKFKSSAEKYMYLESFINRNKSCANITNYFFMVSTYIESNEIVNNYVKLEGYTNQLLKRKTEIELLIEEMKIKYMDEIGECLDMPCEARLAMVFMETALATHMTNLVTLNQRKEQLMTAAKKKST